MTKKFEKLSLYMYNGKKHFVIILTTNKKKVILKQMNLAINTLYD